MNLPQPADNYDPHNEAMSRNAIAQADAQNYKKGQDVEILPGQRAILHAPNGSRWMLAVSNAGALSATAL